MEQKIFLDALTEIRFSVLGGVEMPTPEDFFRLSSEKQQLQYQEIFNAFYDACDDILALCRLMKLVNKEV